MAISERIHRLMLEVGRPLTFQEIRSGFASRRRAEVQRALDSLVESRVLAAESRRERLWGNRPEMVTRTYYSRVSRGG